MIHRCQNCPADTQVLENYLYDQLVSEDNEDESINIEFKQWATVDRSELVQQIYQLRTLFASLLRNWVCPQHTNHTLPNLKQSIKRSVKKNLKKKKVIVLRDFAENYQFVIQDKM